MKSDDDTRSVFDYDEEDGVKPVSFSLTALTSVANRLFSPTKCTLEKLAEGGYHKVRLILNPSRYRRKFASMAPRFTMSRQATERNLVSFAALQIPVFQRTSWNPRYGIIALQN